jgi:hypothetical protein
LTTVEGNLRVEENESLQTLDGLEGLGSVGFSIEVAGNPALTDIAAFQGLATVGSDVTIHDNSLLCRSVVDSFIANCAPCSSIGDLSGNDEGC